MIYSHRPAKPGNIVQVLHDDYRHYGEVMSMRTPGGTYMVRMVPGVAATLKEIPESRLELIERDVPKHVHLFEVKGFGQFPVDMLRYDMAAPFNFHFEEDRWGHLCKPVLDSEWPEGSPLVVAIASRHRMPDRSITPQRWSSFMWSIKFVKTLPIQEAA